MLESMLTTISHVGIVAINERADPIAIGFQKAGYATVASLRSVEAATPALRASGAELIELDVTREESRRAAVDEVIRRHGRLDILINNAGVSGRGPVEDVPLDMLRHVMEFAFKGRLERVGGALCGLLRACVVALFFLLLASLAPQPELAALVTERSVFGRLAATYVRPIYTDLADRRPDLGLPTPATPAKDDGLGEAPAGDSEALGETTIPALSDQTER